ncbi:hypothetical protein NFI96_022806, partial [Prochilodus magdalenae]
MAKIQTSVFCQQYTLNVTRDIARSLKALEMEIVELQNLGATTGNREHIKSLKRKAAILADLLGARVQGALVRSRFQSASEMDVPSKFFFGLKQKNGQKRFMHAVRTESGDLLSEPAQIRKRTVSFFSKLYNSEQSGAPELEESFLHRLPKLTRQSAEMLDRALSLDELYTALQGMENGRAPGIDGLLVEFYKSFWSVLGPPILSRILIAAGVNKLGQLVGLAGPGLTNAENFAAQLGMRSLRVAHQLWYKWSSALTSNERLLLKDCVSTGVSTESAKGNSFPKCTVSPNLGDCGVSLTFSPSVSLLLSPLSLSLSVPTPPCTQKHDLSMCRITEKGCAALVLALKSNPSHLRELDLSWNNPGESGVKLISDLLEDPHCKLEKL